MTTLPDARSTSALQCIGRYGRFYSPVPSVGMPIVRDHIRTCSRGSIPIKMGRLTWLNYEPVSRQWAYFVMVLHRYKFSGQGVPGSFRAWPACMTFHYMSTCLCAYVCVSNTDYQINNLIFISSCRKLFPLETKTKMGVSISTSSQST